MYTWSNQCGSIPYQNNVGSIPSRTNVGSIPLATVGASIGCYPTKLYVVSCMEVLSTDSYLYNSLVQVQQYK